MDVFPHEAAVPNTEKRCNRKARGKSIQTMGEIWHEKAWRWGDGLKQQWKRDRQVGGAQKNEIGSKKLRTKTASLDALLPFLRSTGKTPFLELTRSAGADVPCVCPFIHCSSIVHLWRVWTFFGDRASTAYPVTQPSPAAGTALQT